MYHYPDRSLSTPAFIITVLSAILLTGWYFFAYWGTQQTAQITVLRTDTVISGVGDTASGKYLVYAEFPSGARETLENEDCLLTGKFNSSDVQNELATNIGGKYSVELYGWRIPWLSAYRGICRISPIE